MSTLFVAFIVVGIIAAVILLLDFLAKKQKRQTRRSRHERFSRLGAEHALNFSSQEELNDLLLGLDGVQRKLLVLKHREQTVFHSFLIDLNEVKACSVKKRYGTIGSGELETRKLGENLETISLCFEFRNGSLPREICFYHHVDNHFSESSEREQKATNWNTILSKLAAPARKTA